MIFFRFLLKSSEALHNRMLAAVIRAPVQFFDASPFFLDNSLDRSLMVIADPVGRILNRFANDTGVTDDVLPLIVLDFTQALFAVSSVLLFLHREFVCSVWARWYWLR